MNNNYYTNGLGSPLFTNNGVETPNQETASNLSMGYNTNSYLNESLYLNKGKLMTIYTTFNGSVEWPNKKFTGILEYASLDHLTISDPKTGKWYAIPTIYVNYVESDEKIIE